MPPTYIQGAATAAAQTGSSVAVSFTAKNTTPGNLLIAMFSARLILPTGATIADSQGNIWYQIFAPTDGGTVVTSCAGWWCIASGATKDTVTVTFTTTNMALTIVELSGVNTLDAVAANASGQGATATTNSLSPKSGEMAVGFFTDQSGALAVGSPFGNFIGNAITGNYYAAMEFYAAPAGSLTASMTSAGLWLAILATFKNRKGALLLLGVG